MQVSRVSKEKYSGLVYNLDVDVDESYFANGILVHNCRTTTIAVEDDAEEDRNYKVPADDPQPAGLPVMPEDYEHADRVLHENWTDTKLRSIVRETLARTFDGALGKVGKSNIKYEWDPVNAPAYVPMSKLVSSIHSVLDPEDLIHLPQYVQYKSIANQTRKLLINQKYFGTQGRTAAKMVALTDDDWKSFDKGNPWSVAHVLNRREHLRKGSKATDDDFDISGTIIHEMGHYFKAKANPEINKAMANRYYSQREKELKGKSTPVSGYASASEKMMTYPAFEEYWAETFTAYIVANDFLKTRDPFGYDLVQEFLKGMKLDGKIRIWQPEEIKKGFKLMKQKPVGSRIKGMISGEVKSPEEWMDEWDKIYAKYLGESDGNRLQISPLEHIRTFLSDDFWLDYPLMNGIGFGCFGPPTYWEKYLKSDFEDLSYDEFVDQHIDDPKKRENY